MPSAAHGAASQPRSLFATEAEPMDCRALRECGRLAARQNAREPARTGRLQKFPAVDAAHDVLPKKLLIASKKAERPNAMAIPNARIPPRHRRHARKRRSH